MLPASLPGRLHDRDVRIIDIEPMGLEGAQEGPLTIESSARLGGECHWRFGPSHDTGLADALIAAAAQLHPATLVTLSTKHFPMFPDARRPN